MATVCRRFGHTDSRRFSVMRNVDQLGLIVSTEEIDDHARVRCDEEVATFLDGLLTQVAKETPLDSWVQIVLKLFKPKQQFG